MSPILIFILVIVVVLIVSVFAFHTAVNNSEISQNNWSSFVTNTLKKVQSMIPEIRATSSDLSFEKLQHAYGLLTVAEDALSVALQDAQADREKYILKGLKTDLYNEKVFIGSLLAEASTKTAVN